MNACNSPVLQETEQGDQTGGDKTSKIAPSKPKPALCPKRVSAPAQLNGVEAQHQTAAYWIEQSRRYGDPDEVLLDAQAVDNHNRALQQPRESGQTLPFGYYDLSKAVDFPALMKELKERIDWLNDRFRDGRYLTIDGGKIAPDSLMKSVDIPQMTDESVRLVVALEPIQIHCAPTTATYFTKALDERFNRNLCSMIRSQEPLQIIADWPNGMRLVRTRYSYGWIPGKASVSAPLASNLVGPYLSARKVALKTSWTVPGLAKPLPIGTLLPPSETIEGGVWIATQSSFSESMQPPVGLSTELDRPLTRRGFYESAFRFLGESYGWGGADGGRDCSRLVMDTMATFGLAMPRHSKGQAHAGTFRIDIDQVKNERERVLLMDAAAHRGIVFLHFPGHIMLYLGQTEDGRPMALHAFAEYMEPCETIDPKVPDAVETLRMVDRITVSNLELGRGSSRTSFLERITHITVLGKAPGVALQGSAQLRPPATSPTPETCKDNQANAIYISPEIPHAKGELRIMATRSTDPGPVGLTLYKPDGETVLPELQTLGGPPYTYIARVNEPMVGKWRAVFGDGTSIHACLAFKVTKRKLRRETKTEQAWRVKRRWGEAPENLYGAFVESLFSHPLSEDLTWNNLQSLLQDADKNLLFDHFNKGEEKRLRLRPDCADLPYLLRAYFAWKLGLPFGYRICNRGRAGRPPTCGDLLANDQERPEGKKDIDAFGHFARRRVQNGVHSASGRTHPKDNKSDYYPVELTRQALKPGTLYADPHGHILMIARWIPQTVTSYGTLVAADAQPDGTIGRRRFWRGSFLFSPDTTNVGAGFKAFRPVIWHRDGPKATSNRRLKKTTRFARYSLAQYESSVDDFYDTMAGLINPRPLDPIAMQLQLVDALNEAVSRRVVSVDNGEGFMEKRGYKPIKMPSGYSLFETTGPWEDFSTPARDMRLLISIDTVMKFADVVRRQPTRYGLKAGQETDEAIQKLVDARDKGLSTRRFSYKRSDGQPHQLTLADVTARAKQFEMSYNPNDCIELRWGASPESPEMAFCRRRAPKAQQKRMVKYRTWFIERQRPPR